MGTTGAREQLDDRLAGMIGIVKEAAGDTPVLTGFGISQPAHVAAVLAAGADGVVVGSAAVDAADRGGAAELEAFVHSLATALR
jgi:tryptophan synthase alpha chain